MNNKKYGLLGETLGHSFSKVIHEQLANYTYDLIPLSREELHTFMEKRQFAAVNVTIPYKQEVIAYLDEISPAAKEIGAVNTVVNRKGRLYGYNTDIDGFLYLLQKNGINMLGQNVMILGSGGTSKTVRYAAKLQKARSVTVVSRRAGEGVVTYEECSALKSTDIIVNTSPAGMFPHAGECLIAPQEFPQLKAVVDVVYNPLKTELLLRAEECGVKAVNGLRMLVAQAKFACELFTGRRMKNEQIERVYAALNGQLCNLVLIGMPGCGKSTIGRKLRRAMNRELVDVDREIVRRAGMRIPQIFETYGEAHFRRLESELIRELSVGSGRIISTGGGAVTREENMRALRQNGVFVFLDRAPERVYLSEDRPLASNREDLMKLYRQRYPLYQKYADITVRNNGKLKTAVEAIEEKWNEASRH